jgi:hypothetical protein
MLRTCYIKVKMEIDVVGKKKRQGWMASGMGVGSAGQ